MVELFQFSLLALSAIFVIVDPIGVVPLFLALTPGASAEKQRIIARRACLVAWGILIGFSVGGTLLLELFGITLSAFKVAGGLLMLLTAMDMLRGQPTPTRTTNAETDEGRTKDDVSIVPLAIPLLSGPGSIATSMMLMSRAEGIAHRAIVVGAITLTLAVTFWLLLVSDRVARLLGTTGRLVVERLIGLVLAAIAVQFILDGVVEVLRK